MMQHYPLYPRQVLGKAVQKEALKLVPVYKQHAPAQPSKTQVVMEQPQESSSPVCYAHLNGLREGFED